jgi:hypothetical protein
MMLAVSGVTRPIAEDVPIAFTVRAKAIFSFTFFIVSR